MARRLHVCEAPAAEGEKKWCATSLESMVDFAMCSLGTKNVRVVSTIVGKEGTPRQQYTLTGVMRADTDQLVVCHAKPYAYAMFVCQCGGQRPGRRGQNHGGGRRSVQC
ncbi:hypothetical protein ZWY2020_037067 [Hordeum vulgare]|nr:hypothetical protein ZWY2020_037067 [Hordeum vulgare]